MSEDTFISLSKDLPMSLKTQLLVVVAKDQMRCVQVERERIVAIVEEHLSHVGPGWKCAMEIKQAIKAKVVGDE